jgi:hypothetical protein
MAQMARLSADIGELRAIVVRLTLKTKITSISTSVSHAEFTRPVALWKHQCSKT